jgi:DNA mismatch repair ATPase MutL
MFRTRLFQLFLLVLALAFVTEGVVPRNNKHAVEVRQVDDPDISLPVENLPTGDPGDGESADPTDTETGEPTDAPTDAQPTDDPTSTEADPTTTDPPPETSEPPPPTSTPESSQDEETTTSTETTSEPSTTEAPTTTSAEEDPTSSATSTEEEGPTSTSSNEDNEDNETSREPFTSTKFEVVTKTNSGGEVELSTSTSITTETPDLNDGDGGSGDGLAPETRDIIIGVVVGVGGAIILGALAIVAWRIRARKKLAEENDGLMEYNGGYTAVDKTEPSVPGSSPSNAPNNSPFQSTLENYHQPTQPVNASSNF